MSSCGTPCYGLQSQSTRSSVLMLMRAIRSEEQTSSMKQRWLIRKGGGDKTPSEERQIHSRISTATTLLGSATDPPRLFTYSCCLQVHDGIGSPRQTRFACISRVFRRLTILTRLLLVPKKNARRGALRVHRLRMWMLRVPFFSRILRTREVAVTTASHMQSSKCSASLLFGEN